MTESREDYESDSEVHVLLANEEAEEHSENDFSSLYPEKDVTVLDGNRTSLTSKKIVLKVYKRRWFILGLFSLLSFMQVSIKIEFFLKELFCNIWFYLFTLQSKVYSLEHMGSNIRIISLSIP